MDARYRPDLSRLLRPRSIALIGGKFAAAVARQCRLMGYDGDIWPVNPGRNEIEGLPCYASLDDLPGVPDAAFVAVNRHACIDLVAQLSTIGTGGVICYASGFAEVGEDGEVLQQDLLRAAGQMPLIGPNCYGLINYLDGALLWPDIHGGQKVERGVALVTQSSNMAINLTMQRRGLPVAYVGTMGNQAQIGISDMIAALAEDDRVTAIGLHIEGIDDVRAFAAAAGLARSKGKPVVVLKTGASETASEIMKSHTASLAGEDRVAGALFRRLGIGRVFSIPHLLETLKLLHLFGTLPGTDMLSMSCSGGEASLISDIADQHDVWFRSFSAEEAEAVRETVNPLVSVSNPFDYHTFDWADEERLIATFTAAISAGFDLSCIVLDFPRDDRCERSDWDICVSAIKQAQDDTGARVAIVASMPENLPEDVAEDLMADGILPLSSLEAAVVAVEVAGQMGAWQSGEVAGPVKGLMQGNWLSEADSKDLLREVGLPVPAGKLVEVAEDTKDIARPLALKAAGTDIQHKSELGAVRLGLSSDEEIMVAIKDLSALGEVVLAEEMVQGGIGELIIGVRQDPVVGPWMLIGSGGVLTEVLADNQILLFPFTRDEVANALGTLKGYPLLTGFRGKPAADINAVIDICMSIQAMCLRTENAIVEIEINPLIVRGEGKGAIAVDAAIRKSGDT